MGTKINKVKLFTGIIYNIKEDIENIYNELEAVYGEIDLKSEIIDFNFTDYYNREMGSELLRTFVSFKTMIKPDELARIKNTANLIEDKFRIDGKRRVNIDPGYITLSNLVLASTKNYSHRIYLKRGVFAEVSLIYTNKRFNCLSWTYPDYRDKRFLIFFEKVREIYKGQLSGAK